MRFLNRVLELAMIDDFLTSRRSELVVIYGRRGAGKSTLLIEAMAGQPHMYYQATTREMPQQLEDMTAALRTFRPDLMLPGVLPSIDAFLEAIVQMARAQPDPVVVIIDELPYLAQADPAIPTILQRWWDTQRREHGVNIKLFLLGSLVSWMEEQTLSEHGPLHNRRTGQLHLKSLSYRDAALFYPAYRPEDRIAAYAIWGGLPSYLDEIQADSAIWNNVQERILQPGARLAEEPRWLRFGDLRGDALYASILRAIAQGERRPGKIAQAVGRSRADDVAYQLDRLCDMGLVRRVVPVHERDARRSRNALYILADNYVAFWYRFVDKLRHLLAMRRYDEALASIQADFDQYVAASVFEDVCRQFMWEAAIRRLLPKDLAFDAVGSWWIARDDVQDEIDVVAMDGNRTVLVGECKWSMQPCGMRELDGLRAGLHKGRAQLNPIDQPWLALFSRSGFTPDVAALAADSKNRVLLFEPADLY